MKPYPSGYKYVCFILFQYCTVNDFVGSREELHSFEYRVYNSSGMGVHLPIFVASLNIILYESALVHEMVSINRIAPIMLETKSKSRCQCSLQPLY